MGDYSKSLLVLGISPPPSLQEPPGSSPSTSEKHAAGPGTPTPVSAYGVEFEDGSEITERQQ